MERFHISEVLPFVLNQVDAVTAAIEGGHHHLLHENQIGLPLKVIFLMEVDEIGVVQTDRSKDLLGMALPQRGNLRLAATLGPGGMQGGRLPKRSLVFENKSPRLRFWRFFLIRVGVAYPFALLFQIGLHQSSGRPLHGVAQVSE